ncbi:MAG: CbtB-domain containing protein [Nocardioidaceae bacterium]
MTKPVFAAPVTPLRPAAPVAVPLWAWALVAVALLSVYVLLQENGALLNAGQAAYLHELTHDARHALGVPCH